MLQTSSASFSRTAIGRSLPRVLFVMYSGAQYYETRVRSVLETWGKALPSSQLLIIGDQPATFGNISVITTDCVHDHWEGMCCKYAKAVIHARAAMDHDPTVDWAYFLDDDSFARPQAIAQALAKVTQSGVVAAMLGCEAHGKCSGICGGGGYAADRKAITRAVGENPESFLAAQMRLCATDCERWADISLTQVFKARNISLQFLPGLYAFPLTAKEFDDSLVAEAEPLLYHYVNSPQQYHSIDEAFRLGRNANRTKL